VQPRFAAVAVCYVLAAFVALQACPQLICHQNGLWSDATANATLPVWPGLS
jgi:hypothetical protein